jgi:hypothetical protein
MKDGYEAIMAKVLFRGLLFFSLLIGASYAQPVAPKPYGPVPSTKMFTAVTARYVKLSALKNTEDNDSISYAEVDVITK